MLQLPYQSERVLLSLGLYPKVKLFHRLTSTDWDKVTMRYALSARIMLNAKSANCQEGNFNPDLDCAVVQEADCIFLDEPFVELIQSVKKSS